jgi:hypothetical protein
MRRREHLFRLGEQLAREDQRDGEQLGTWRGRAEGRARDRTVDWRSRRRERTHRPMPRGSSASLVTQARHVRDIVRRSTESGEDQYASTVNVAFIPLASRVASS